jgi:hypothetical protein
MGTFHAVAPSGPHPATPRHARCFADVQCRRQMSEFEGTTLSGQFDYSHALLVTRNGM